MMNGKGGVPLGRILVQIYEIQEPREAEGLLDLDIDHLGSVLLSRADWRVSAIREVVRLLRGTPVRSTLIPLFDDPETVFRALDYYQPDIVHFCDALPPFLQAPEAGAIRFDRFVSLQAAVRDRHPEIRIMRSLPLPPPGTGEAGPEWEATMERVGVFAPRSDLFLTDTVLGPASQQPVAGFVGITGETCDWDLAARLVALSPVPVILAGGLSPDNTFEAVLKVRPAGVDSCTHTNALDAQGRPIRFRKNPEKVRRLVAETRRAERHLAAASGGTS